MHSVFEVVYSTGYGVNRVQIGLSGFSMRLFCFVQAKTVYMVVCVDVMVIVIFVGHDMKRCSGWWQVFSVHVK